MKKRLYSIIFLCSLVSIMLCACNNSADGITETVTFQATVIEATNNSILVEPIEGSQELSSSDRFRIPNKDGLELQTGDIIEIEYNGDILESYPAQLGEVYNITKNRQEVVVPETVTFEQEITEELETANRWESEVKQLEARPVDISVDIPFGSNGPQMDFAGKLGRGEESIIVFHDYFGLFVYDFSNRKVIRSLDLAPIGCNVLQGDEACQVVVSADGTTVWLHPQTKDYMYRYEIPENLLYQESLVKTFEEELEDEELFDRYLAMEEQPIAENTGWCSNFLYEEVEDVKGNHKAYIYLVFHLSDEDKPWLLTLQCVWDDMVCVLFEDNGDI